jgi:threonine/homoserine/homoserine lactone efflux protein
MTAASLLAYGVALALAVATPGPAAFAVVATGVSRGRGAARAFALGVAIADVALVGLVLLGLATIASNFGWAFFVVKSAGSVYLVYLGVKMWRARPAAGVALPDPASRSFLAGAGVALGNPKALFFHASLMPLLLDLVGLTLGDAAVVLALVFTVNTVIMGAYAALSSSARGWFRTHARQRALNRAGGAAMIGAGVFMATR